MSIETLPPQKQDLEAKDPTHSLELSIPVSAAERQYNGFVAEEGIKDSLDTSDTPLTTTQLKELQRLAEPTSETDPLEFVERLADLSPNERAQFDAYQIRQAEFAQDMDKIYQLKLEDPQEFKRRFNEATPANQGKFDAYEAREDAKRKAENPDVRIPKLSSDGETWVAPMADEMRALGESVISKEKLSALHEARSSSDPEMRKGFADTVKEMPVEDIIAMNKDASERRARAQEQAEAQSTNYLASVYRDSKSPNLQHQQAFQNEMHQWTPNQFRQYQAYAAEQHAIEANQQRKGWKRFVPKFLRRKK
jgi:hypothetical protein